MSANWYPVIDDEKCVGCLQCVEFCPHDVYEERNGKPVVSRPEECVEFWRGCQKGACDNDAISYAGSSAEAAAK